ncbi:ribosome maturation factor RimP [Artemisia annua]|uniref:Ribosome maturation factor RimP n=1 Tax=Artemisia annua TaxID=35608 RepID=A0A2U1QL18_ARTAN|nr:ribosome maturation factor RimP [Artemisia annua]
MMMVKKKYRKLLPLIQTHRCLPSSPLNPVIHHHHFHSNPHNNPNNNLNGPHNPPLKVSSSFHLLSATHHQYYSTVTTASENNPEEEPQSDSNDEVEPIDLWEEEDESEPEIGDGGNGGGVVLQNCPWGQKVLSIAQEVLLQYGDDIEIFAFKTSPRGYIYVRLDRLCNEYGCPSIEDIKSYNNEYKKRLDEAGAKGDIPNDLAVEVSSPGADRLLRIPGDLQRFKDMAMRVKYVEDDNPRSKEKEGVYFLVSTEAESESSVWKLADVKENRDPKAKGRPMSRKLKDWRLELPYEKLKQVTLYLDYH